MKTTKTSHMVKKLTTAFSLVLSLAALTPAAAQKRGSSSGTSVASTPIKFLDAIEVNTVGAEPEPVANTVIPAPIDKEASLPVKQEIRFNTAEIENASTLQLKYAVLLNTEVEQVQDAVLFEAIDDWYGTRYVLGGASKDGIDCSAFVQVMYSKVFQTPMPRTAKEQYKAARPISRTEMQKGDLVFFHTRGSGVTHVGIYLQNNKFVHAATSGGVMISDLFEAYWVKRFMGVGRIDKAAEPEMATLKP